MTLAAKSFKVLSKVPSRSKIRVEYIDVYEGEIVQKQQWGEWENVEA